MKFHEVANIFPMMTDTEFEGLKASIKEDGVHEPVLIADGMIADGRNRWKACDELGIDCPTVQYNPTKHGQSLVQYVMARNLHRRQMTAGQRAMIATNALPMLEKEAEKREKSGKADPGLNSGQGTEGRSAAVAAKTAGVSRDTVQRAKTLKTEAPALAAEVVAGTKSLNAAVKLSKAPPKPAPKLDGLDRPVENKNLKEAINEAYLLKEIGQHIDAARRGAEALEGKQIATFVEHQQLISQLQSCKYLIRRAEPFTECPYMPNCKRGCKACKSAQWVPKETYDRVPREIREAKTK